MKKKEERIKNFEKNDFQKRFRLEVKFVIAWVYEKNMKTSWMKGKIEENGRKVRENWKGMKEERQGKNYGESKMILQWCDIDIEVYIEPNGTWTLSTEIMKTS